MYSHKHQKMMINNIVTRGGVNTVFQLFTFLENTKHEKLFANQQNAITNFKSFKFIALLFVP